MQYLFEIFFSYNRKQKKQLNHHKKEIEVLKKKDLYTKKTLSQVIKVVILLKLLQYVILFVFFDTNKLFVILNLSF